MIEDQEVIEKNEEIQQKTENNSEEKIEESPIIKSEENQANWKRFREEKEKERKARKEAEELAEKRRQEADALKLAMEAILNKQQQQQNYYPEEETEEQRIEKKIQEALKKERQLREKEQSEREAQELPRKVYQSMPDIDSVCSAENLDYLDFHHPEISKAFKYLPENYEKYETIYKAIKKYVPFQQKKEDLARIEKNVKKPQAHIPNITEQNPMGSPWKLSEERKKENWKRMMQDAKRF